MLEGQGAWAQPAGAAGGAAASPHFGTLMCRAQPPARARAVFQLKGGGGRAAMRLPVPSTPGLAPWGVGLEF